LPVAVNCSVVPRGVDAPAGVTVIDVSCTAEPMPRRVAVCGLLPALSTTVRVPELLPATVGVKVTLIEHIPFGAMDAGQALAANGPVVDTLVMLKEVDCKFVRITAWAGLVDPTPWLGNCRLVGDRDTLEIPVPDRVTVCGLVFASSKIVSVPAMLPVVEGVNVTLMTQVPLGAIGVVHALAAKAAGVAVILLMFRGTDWLFVSVTVLGALVVLTAWLLKVIPV